MTKMDEKTKTAPASPVQDKKVENKTEKAPELVEKSNRGRKAKGEGEPYLLEVKCRTINIDEDVIRPCRKVIPLNRTSLKEACLKQVIATMTLKSIVEMIKGQRIEDKSSEAGLSDKPLI